jgi:hypothetical protein
MFTNIQAFNESSQIFTATYDYTLSPPSDFSTSNPGVSFAGSPQIVSWNVTGIGQIRTIYSQYRWYYDDGVFYERAPAEFNNFQIQLDCPNYPLNCPTTFQSFTANPNSVPPGSPVSLSWEVLNLGTNHIQILDGSNATVTNSNSPKAAFIVNPTATTFYRLVVVDSSGTQLPCFTPRDVTVTVTNPTRRGHFEVRYTPPQGADPAGNYPAAGTVWVGPTVECPDWSCAEYTTARNAALGQQNTLIATESNRLGAINDARYQAYLTALAEWRAQYGGASTFDEARAWQLEQYAVAQQNYQGALNGYYANYCGNVPANCPAPGTTITGPMATPYYTFLFPTRMATPKNVSSSFP